MSLPLPATARVEPVGPRVPKEEFMRALGLDVNNQEHEGHYRAMRDEAIAAYNKLNADRNSLVDEKRTDGSYQPPFFWHHIRRDRQQKAVIDIWQGARAGTVQRSLFDMGVTSGEHQPNWVTLWLLYSVFRSRDIRNSRSRRSGDDKPPGGSRGGASEPKIYDPARNIMVPR